MNVGVARRDRRLPAWLGGPLVSELAYRMVDVAFPRGIPRAAARVQLEVPDEVSTLELVEELAERLDADEADVLRALAELEAVGVLSTRGRGER